MRYIIFILVVALYSCKTDNNFSNEELRFVKPFNKTDTVIYKSTKGLIDTIIFFPKDSFIGKVSSFEQGFYKQNILTVEYILTPNSYHKFIIVDGSNIVKPKQFLGFYKSDIGNISKEIKFLGLIFSEKSIDKISKSNQDEVIFNDKDADYVNMNIVEGIKSFKFNFSTGIVSFIDNDNVLWEKVPSERSKSK